jgi:hypothetical protein
LVAATIAGAAAAVGLAGCGSSTKTVPAATLLVGSRRTLNAATAVHFTVTSDRLPSSGTVLESGSGDLTRPSELRGSFQIAIDSLPTSISIIEADNKFYVKLPFASKYQLSNPSKFGFGDPAQLINPSTGISRLLTRIAGPRLTGRTRVNGEVLERITGTVPGNLLTEFLPDAAPAKPVQVVLGINPKSYQVRQVQVTGPFASAGTQSTYLVTLTKYNETVAITAPPI